jgi:hypothetical protein
MVNPVTSDGAQRVSNSIRAGSSPFKFEAIVHLGIVSTHLNTKGSMKNLTNCMWNFADLTTVSKPNVKLGMTGWRSSRLSRISESYLNWFSLILMSSSRVTQGLIIVMSSYIARFMS